MKITIYTINDCKFSQAEKQYLTSKNIQFEEKNLETNREYLTEMLNISNNFAGTPVTKIEKDDGTSVVLKGFTQSEFDTALGFSTESVPVVETKTEETTTTDTSATPPVGVSTAAVAQTASETPTIDTPVSAATPAESSAPAIDSISTTEPTVPSIDTTAPTVEESQPDISLSTPSTPSVETPSVASMPTDTASDPVPTTPTPMGNPLTDTTPSVTPTTPDFSAQPQGEAIPDVPSPDTNQPSATPDLSPQNMGGMSQAPEQSNQQQPPTNDPLSSVLNDLQSKGSN